MKIYVKKVDGVVLPQKGSDLAAGYDIIATSEPKIVGNQIEASAWKRIDYVEYETNLYIAPSAVTFHTLIHPRSSVSKYNLVLANSIGLVDNDYRGMVICRFKYIWQPEDIVCSDGVFYVNPAMDRIYKKGDKIAQLVVEPTVMADWVFVDDLNATSRGEGGFGSTDKPVTQSDIPTTGKLTNLAEIYTKAGGIPIKERYADEVKKRQES